MPWNRTHRPTKLSDLHLSKVREQLEHLVSTQKVPQALLFAGPKGTGKTSSARIIGALLNDPQNAKVVSHIFFGGKQTADTFKDPDVSQPIVQKILQGSSFTVHEMDAASNRGIDNIRELTDRISLPPQEGLISVYILDEAHMLTTEAFNALLKVLEEPPQHVVFILATTELHKIPATIVSRCHTIPFYKASSSEMKQALSALLAKENISSTPESLDAITAAADGSFRDVVKLAEQSVRGSKLDPSAINLVSSTALLQYVDTYLQSVLEKNPATVVSFFSEIRQKALPPKQFHVTLLQKLHSIIVSHYLQTPTETTLSHTVALFLLKELQDTSLSEPHLIPFLPLEIKTLEIIDRATHKKPPTPPKTNAIQPQEPTEISKAKKIQVEPTPTLSKKVPVSSLPNLKDLPKGDGSLLVAKWNDFVDKVAEKNTTIAALLRSAKPISGSEGSVTISVFYKFHQEQLSEPTFLHRIQEFVTALCGGYLVFDFQLAAAPAAAELLETQQQTTDLARLASESLM